MIYFHCTSDVFLKSILKNGLGKINPNIDYKLLSLLSYLFEIAKKELPKDKIESLLFTTQLMVNQEIKYVDKKIYGVEVLNFKHDGVFLTLGDRAAITHSHHTKYGSEILTRIIQILTLIQKEGIEFNIPDELNLIELEQIVKHKPKPIFIKVQNINDYYLYNQHDKHLFGTMRFIEEKLKITSENVKFRFNNTSVFKYVRPIPPNDIEVYYLDYDGHPTDDDFEYYLERVK
jgi:hypothetical protein